MTPQIISTLTELRSKVAGWKAAGESVAVVPTMGALHQGHLSLVRAGKEVCDRVIVTIFITTNTRLRVDYEYDYNYAYDYDYDYATTTCIRDSNDTCQTHSINKSNCVIFVIMITAILV